MVFVRRFRNIRLLGTGTNQLRCQIYGGGFSVGGAQWYGSLSHSLVEKSVAVGMPVMFVSINYRLNAYGFMPGQEMMDDETASPNADIAAFGGDPRKVTAFGESAGSISISCLLMAFDGKLNGLFRGAVMFFSYKALALPFLPRTDGIVLKLPVNEAYTAGKWAKEVAIISGDQYDEGTLLSLGTLNVTNDAAFDKWMSDTMLPRSTEEQRARIMEL
ncbi:hypothetical protein RQP46_010847 [Phenoliferia psychrophenolica]